MKTSKRAASAVIWIFSVIIIWEIAAYVLQDVLNDPLAEKKVPSLITILTSYADHFGTIMHQAGITFSYAAAGFFAGAAAGILLALVMRLSGIIEKIALPYLLASQMIPILGLAPIIFGLFKDVEASRIVIAGYISFFPVSVNFLSGMKSVGEEFTALMSSYGTGKVQLYRKLLIPYSLPYLFAGLKLAAPMAVTASILADTLSSRDGIGYIIIYSLYGGGTKGQFWPALFTAAIMGLVSFFIVTALEYIAVPWKRGKGDGAV